MSSTSQECKSVYEQIISKMLEELEQDQDLDKGFLEKFREISLQGSNLDASKIKTIILTVRGHENN